MSNIVKLSIYFTIMILVAGCTTNRSNTEIPLMPTPSGNFPNHFERLLAVDSEVVSAPVVYDDSIIIRTKKSLYRYSSYGELIWRVEYPAHRGMYSPKVCGDLIVTPVETPGDFVVISIKDGSEVWKSEDPQRIPKGQDIQDVLCYDALIYVAKYNSGIFAYNLWNGQTMWDHELPDRSSIYLSMDTIKQEIYVVAGDRLTAYNLYTGVFAWDLIYNTFVGPATMLQNKLVIVLGPPANTEVTLVDLSARMPLWRTSATNFLGNTFGGITTDDNVAYLTGNKVIALSLADGEILWETQETEQLRRPVLFKNNLYVRNNGNVIYAFDIQTGKINGELHVGEESILNSFDRSPAILDDYLIIPFGDKRIFIYRP